MTAYITNLTPELEDRLWTVARIGRGKPLGENQYIGVETSNGTRYITEITSMTWAGQETLSIVCMLRDDANQPPKWARIDLDLRDGYRYGSITKIGHYR